VSTLSIPTVILGISALLVASRIIIKRAAQIPQAARASIIETLDACIFAAVLSLVIITFIVQAFYIPSGSMEPTLMVDDRILVAKFLYRFEPVRRGDVIAKSGASGRVTSPHLHYEVRMGGTPVNPYPFLMHSAMVLPAHAQTDLGF